MKDVAIFIIVVGIGWTSWKKRWFILTQTSLVFYRSDPNATPQKSGEVNLTLGGIDLNSSGSVVVKEDKKLVTVLFSDGRDGRAFTLKAETLEDLFEWKAALEEALANAPNAAIVMGQNGLFKNDQYLNAADASSEQYSKDKHIPKSLVIGGPILLALEDIDGTPSFLEKALRFLEEHGIKTEGILRQAADVEDVKHRIQEYEKGKTDFLVDEDAHVIADCIKYVLRELPSSPVPASCCNALLEACRTERSMRVSAMRSAICETFPEPNRLLLQRILMMMQSVASNKAVNRMSISAVAACMAPLLLRPLLAGDCDLDNDFDVGGDGSVQLLQAAAAANHAQAIVITLLEEYDNIFGDVAETHEPYTDSEESGSESEEMSDDESFDEEDEMTEESEFEEDEDFDDHESSSETGEKLVCGSHSSGFDVVEASQKKPSFQHDSVQGIDDVSNLDDAKTQTDFSNPDEISLVQELSHGGSRRPTVWGRAVAKKNLSMESIDLPLDDEAAIQKLECLKTDIETKILNEETMNSHLQDSLETRKYELHERRLGLQKDVARLQEQLHKETELRKALEAALRISQLPLSISSLNNVDDKMKVEIQDIVQAESDVASLKNKADDLESQLNQQRGQTSRLGHDISNQLIQNETSYKSKEKQKGGGDMENSCTSKHESKAGNGRDKNMEMGINTNSNYRHGSLSRKCSSRTHEGTNSTTSALSKLTNRLNFLKERPSELQGMEHDLKRKSSERIRGGDKIRKPQNLERGKSESFPTPDKDKDKDKR
ncbi:hypothetical protein ACS0TY_023786 [Phlomoides rotata]